jgi:hypothetical protein
MVRTYATFLTADKLAARFDDSLTEDPLFGRMSSNGWARSSIP